MFQLWKLVLLCGLLTGTSASLLDGLGVGKILDETKSIVNVVDNTVGAVGQKLKDELAGVQGFLNERIQDVLSLVGNSLPQILSTGEKILDIKISDSALLNPKFEPTADGKGINVRFPIKAQVSLALPLTGEVLDLKVSLDLLSGVKVVADPKTGVSKVVLGECIRDPASISVSLLDKYSKTLNRVLKVVTTPVQNAVSLLVQNVVCPVIHSIINAVSVDGIQQAIGLQAWPKWLGQ
ncbi:BPI fold-containing family A member 2 [Tupaia chinensis]|uniref:BPI fold-containing family A member 2 n=1 Tax=Tupaia chinensis TaxID=246437 RepID=UPI0003C92395|nr:BPI fold-containing family A member 2 [Tupaia chinensis]